MSTPSRHSTRATEFASAGTLLLQAVATLVLAAAAVDAAEPSAAPPGGLIASPEPGWPQWRGLHRDGISHESGLLARWPEDGPRLLWKADGLGTGWSSPIVVGDRLYITGDVENRLVVGAYDLGGSPRWRTENGSAWTGPYPGARATCAFSAGRLYHLNAHGRLACLAADSGRELWAVNILERFGGENITWALSECLLVDGPHVIVTPGGSRGLMAALDKTNGQTVWTTPLPSEADRASHSSPILFQWEGRRLITNCSAAHGFGVDADSGQLLWTVPLQNQFGVNAATPIYGAGQVFYVTPYAEEGRAYRLRVVHSLREGDPGPEKSLAADLVWTSPLDTVTGSAVLLDGVLYAGGYRKSKWWLGLDWATGRVVAEQKEFTTGAAISVGGQLYVLDERGTVGLLQPGDLSVLGRFALVQERVRDAWAHPVLLDGRLYLRYHDTLWCYDVKQPD